MDWKHLWKRYWWESAFWYVDRINRKKHGIGFCEALPAFLDPKRIERVDEMHSSLEEERIDLIGWVKDSLLVFGVYTSRTERIRIISVRKAKKEEIDEYYRDYDARWSEEDASSLAERIQALAWRPSWRKQRYLRAWLLSLQMHALGHSIYSPDTFVKNLSFLLWRCTFSISLQK